MVNTDYNVTRINIVDTSCWLGAVSSVVDSGINHEQVLINKFSRDNSQQVITCDYQKAEFYRNLGTDRFETKRQEYAPQVQELCCALESVRNVNINIEPYVDRYGKDAFVPAMINSIAPGTARLFTRDEGLMKKVKEDFPRVLCVNPIKSE